jgi:hypothetical protein
LFWQKNDVPQNFSPQGLPPEIADLLGVFAFNQTLGTNINQIQKRTATGATYSLRSNVIYDRNNRPNRKYESDFSGFLEAEYRQPLMQGAGKADPFHLPKTGQVPIWGHPREVIHRKNQDRAKAGSIGG